MTVLSGEAGKTVIVFEDGASDQELSSIIEATLRHASQAYRVIVATSEQAVGECLASCEPVLFIIDADRSPALRFERLVVAVRAAVATRSLPVLATVSASNLAALQEAFRLPLVDFILKPLSPDELWGRIRVCLHHAAVLGDLERQNEELARKSMTDSLTGLLNTACIVQRCDQEISRAKRYDQPVSFLLVDVDGFRTVNETHGHPVGNEVLRSLAQLVRVNVRGADTVGRYGGEEFLLILPQTARAGAVTLAERLRKAIEVSTFTVGLATVKVTVSIGVATFPDKGVIGRETMFLAVDRAVYRAKTLGRNLVAWLDDAPAEADAVAAGADGGGPAGREEKADD